MTVRNTPGGSVLALRDVDVWIGSRRVLHEVSFAVSPGEFVGVIGSNGAGKTTMFRAILSLQQVSSGEIRTLGHIGYVPQRLFLEPDTPLRSRDFIALGLDGNKLGLPLLSSRRRLSRRQRVDELIHAVGGEQFADSRVGTLSGGELQRVLIAHALVSGPGLLILDEPLANLDLGSEQEVVELLGRLAKEHQVAVLLAAHDINPLLPVMDTVVYVAGGHVASGPVADIVRPEVLSALYGHPVSVLEAEGRILVVAGSEVHPLDELDNSRLGVWGG